MRSNHGSGLWVHERGVIDKNRIFIEFNRGMFFSFFFFFSSRRRHTRSYGDWSSDVCSSDLEDIAEKSEPGDNGRERVRLRADVEELYLEHVAGLRALHEDRPRERMDRARLHARYVGLGGGWPELPVDAVARVEDDFLAFFDRDDRREVGLEPVG